MAEIPLTDPGFISRLEGLYLLIQLKIDDLILLRGKSFLTCFKAYVPGFYGICEYLNLYTVVAIEISNVSNCSTCQ